MKNDIDWIYIAKGIAIFFVVVGHFYPSGSPQYWSLTRALIYMFHMPLFFFLSGYLYKDSIDLAFLDLMRKKTQRLVIPFISIALIFFVIKFLAGQILILDHPVNAVSFFNLILEPVKSYMPLLWFIHALFFIFIIYFFLSKKISDIGIAVIFILLSFVDFNNLTVNQIIWNTPFFCLGHYYKSSNKVVNGSIQIYFGLFLAFFLSAYLSLIFNNIPIIKYSTAISAIFLILIVSKKLDESRWFFKQALVALGFFSMTIYLFHTLFESTVRILFYRLAANIPFLLVAIIAIASGVIFPLCLEKYFLRKSAIARKFILGMN